MDRKPIIVCPLIRVTGSFLRQWKGNLIFYFIGTGRALAKERNTEEQKKMLQNNMGKERTDLTIRFSNYIKIRKSRWLENLDEIQTSFQIDDFHLVRFHTKKLG